MPACDTAMRTQSIFFQGWETNPDQEPNEACSAYTKFLLDTAVHEVNVLRLFRFRGLAAGDHLVGRTDDFFCQVHKHPS